MDILTRNMVTNAVKVHFNNLNIPNIDKIIARMLDERSNDGVTDVHLMAGNIVEDLSVGIEEGKIAFTPKPFELIPGFNFGNNKPKQVKKEDPPGKCVFKQIT